MDKHKLKRSVKALILVLPEDPRYCLTPPEYTEKSREDQKRLT